MERHSYTNSTKDIAYIRHPDTWQEYTVRNSELCHENKAKDIPLNSIIPLNVQPHHFPKPACKHDKLCLRQHILQTIPYTYKYILSSILLIVLEYDWIIIYTTATIRQQPQRHD